MRAQDELVIQRVRAHHAAMSARLQGLTLAVAEAADGSELAEGLATLLWYWRHEVMPHAEAEETTIYAAAVGVPEARVLVRSLEHEHRDLRRRVAVLHGLHARAHAAATASETGRDTREPPLRVQAATEAAGAAAVFHVHADKENDFVLPVLATGGRALPELLSQMEQAFRDARRAAETLPDA